VFANYYFDITSKLFNPAYYTGASMWLFPLKYLLIYFGVLIFTLLLRKELDMLKNPAVYIKSAVIVLVYSFTIGFYTYNNWHFPIFTHIENVYLVKIFSQLKMACFVLVPLFLLKKYYDREVPGLYGLCKSKSLMKGYLTLFLIMLPFLIITSFTSDFQYSYPQFRPQYYNGVFGMPTWLYTFLFEVCYSVDFLLVELIFRGTLVVGMIRLLGTKAVLPMVALYVSIHFGKPLVETCSSMFGGFILGALAYQTKHIWGGVIVHIGIALVMEIMGFVQYYLLK
jgi:hypothetical protein